MSKSEDDKIGTADWKLLDQMRQAYLGDKAETLWSTTRSLELYDKFFGRRIADKWFSALDLLSQRGHGEDFKTWAAQQSGPMQIWDWGCGTGRATRSLLETFGMPAQKLEVVLSDKLPFVEDWAWAAVQGENKKFEASRIKSSSLKIDNFVLLVSHVLNELSSSQAGALADVSTQAAWVFWVENGSKSTSRHLSMIRNKLRHTHDILAPCLGQGGCPAVEGKPHSHWCHFFADRTADYFLDSDWAEFSKQLGVDLRSIPYSFFVARKKVSAEKSFAKTYVDNQGMRIGTARLYKGYADALVCDSNTQLQEWRYPKKQYSTLLKELKKDKADLIMSAP